MLAIYFIANKKKLCEYDDKVKKSGENQSMCAGNLLVNFKILNFFITFEKQQG